MELLSALVCLGFAGSAVAWADAPGDPPPVPQAPPDIVLPALPPIHTDNVEDPYAPHSTSGMTFRLGTAVGFIYGERVDTVAVGPTIAIGHRWGRFQLEGEYDYLALHDAGITQESLGRGQRLGLIARFEFIRFGSHYVGQNSMLSIYGEGGAASAWNTWFRPGPNDPDRTVPADTRRLEGEVGFGILLDHRLQEPHGLKRFGWFLGWRLALAPHDAEPSAVCRGSGTCDAMTTAPDDHGYTDRSMLFQSSLMATW